MASLNGAVENKKTVVAEIVRHGSKMILPDGMSLSEAKSVIEAKQVEEETIVELRESLDVFVWEGAYALNRVLDERYGWFEQIVAKATSFFDEDRPPAMISVAIGPDKTIQIPWGRFRLPNMSKADGWLDTSYDGTPGDIPKFALVAKLKKKHSAQFHDLCSAVRERLSEYSLYRGKTITINFFDEDGDRLKFPEPKFTKVNPLAEGDLIFSKHLDDAIRANLYTPIVKAEECRKHGIPLKRGVGLVGSYGTGKSLVSQRVATLANEHGWTYIYCPRTYDFVDCVKFARRYQPAVVFCEDIDKSTHGERSVQMDDILNTIDGIDAKNTEIILVLTSNTVESINQAMLRPGRMDAVITMEYPDAEAVNRLLRRYMGNLYPEGESLEKISNTLAGSTPAVIREVVERSKLYALAAGGDGVTINEESLLGAAYAMQSHRKLLEATVPDIRKPVEVFAEVLGKHLENAITEAAKIKMAIPGEKPALLNGHAHNY